MTSKELRQTLNEERLSNNISMLKIANDSGRYYRSVRNFFKNNDDTTLYLVLDILDALSIDLVMNGRTILCHEDAIKVIQEAFGQKEYSATSKEIGMSSSGLKGVVLGINSRISTFLKVCQGLNIEVKTSRKSKEGEADATGSKLH